MKSNTLQLQTMSDLSCSCHSQPLGDGAAGPGDGDLPEDLQELLGNAIPPVQAALRALLDLDAAKEFLSSEEGDFAAVQELAAAKTSNMWRLGRDELSDLVCNAATILQIAAVLICSEQTPDGNARTVASVALLQPAPARAALLRLLAAVVRWEPGAQLPPASGKEHQQEEQPGTLHNAAAPSSGGEQDQPGDATGAAPAAAAVAAEAPEEEEEEQRQRPEAAGHGARLAQDWMQYLCDGVCQLVSQLLISDCSLPELVGSNMPKLLRSLDFGCSLLQTHLLQCLSRQLAGASEGLVGLLPPPPAKCTDSEGQQAQEQQQGEGQLEQQQQQQQEEGRQGSTTSQPPPSLSRGAQPATGQLASEAASVSTSGLLHAVRRAVKTTNTLMPCLHGLMTFAADLCCSASPAAAATGSGSGLGPSHGSQPLPDAAAHKQLRQLSRRFLLLMACGLRDSHLYDHWARALLLSALCRAELGKEWVQGLGEESAGLAAGVGGRSQQQGYQTQRGKDFYPDEQIHWGCLHMTDGKLQELTSARISGSDSSLCSLPPALDSALEQALSGPCTQHLTLALGVLMLHEADGASLYGTPLPYRTGALAEALAVAGRRPATGNDSASPRTDLQPLDRALYCNLARLLLGRVITDVVQPLPTVPPEGRLDLLLRLGSFAVRSAQAYRGQGGSAGPRVEVMEQGDIGVILLPVLRFARVLLSARGGKLPEDVRNAAGPAAGAGAGAGAAAAAGAAAGAMAGGGPGAGAGSKAGTGAGAGPEAGSEAGAGAGAGAGGSFGDAAADGEHSASAPPFRQAGPATGDIPPIAGPTGRRRAAAARRAARAAVAAETRWHRLLLDTGLWVEMDDDDLAVWAEAWNHLESLGELPGRTGALPLAAPAPVAGALAACMLPVLERELRRAGKRRGGELAEDPPLLHAFLSPACRWWPTLGWLLSYADIRQGASFMITLRKLVVRQVPTSKLKMEVLQGLTERSTAPTQVTYSKAPYMFTNALLVGREGGRRKGNRDGVNGSRGSGVGSVGPGGSSGGGGGGSAGSRSGSSGDGCGVSGGDRGTGGGGGGGGDRDGSEAAVGGCASGSSSSAEPCGQGSSGMDSPGLPRLQLLLWYGVRQLMPPMAAAAVGCGSDMAGALDGKSISLGATLSLMGAVLPPAALMALQVASAGVNASDAGSCAQVADGGGAADGHRGCSSGAGASASTSASKAAEGVDGGSPPAWLSSWRRVLLEEWRVVELVGTALEQLVPVLGSDKEPLLAFADISPLQSLTSAVCAVALAFPEQVWSAAGASGAGSQRQIKAGRGTSTSGKGGGKRAAPDPAPPAVWVWPTGRVEQLLDAARAHLRLGLTGYLEPELDALSKLLDLARAGGPELPYKYDAPFVQATLELQVKSDLVGGFRWLSGEVPTPELLDALLRTCSYPKCASLEGDSEAGAEGRLAACGRGCGGAWYCCRACADRHWREGHREACKGGAVAAGCPGGVAGSGSTVG